MSQIDVAMMQRYVNKRLAEKWRKKPISGRTIHKELVTFHLAITTSARSNPSGGYRQRDRRSLRCNYFHQ